MADETFEVAPADIRGEAAQPASRVTAPIAPPTTPNLALAQRAPKQTWTIVLGVIGILTCVFAAFMGFSGVMMILGVGQMEAKVASGPAVATAPMGGYMSAAGWDYVCSGVLAALLLPGSIGLLMRKRWGPRFIVAWAVVKVIAAVVFGVLIARGFGEMMQATAAQAKTSTPVPTGVVNIMSIVVAVFWSVVACVVPVTALIWFLRRSVREQVRAWK